MSKYNFVILTSCGSGSTVFYIQYVYYSTYSWAYYDNEVRCLDQAATRCGKRLQDPGRPSLWPLVWFNTNPGRQGSWSAVVSDRATDHSCRHCDCVTEIKTESNQQQLVSTFWWSSRFLCSLEFKMQSENMIHLRLNVSRFLDSVTNWLGLTIGIVIRFQGRPTFSHYNHSTVLIILIIPNP